MPVTAMVASIPFTLAVLVAVLALSVAAERRAQAPRPVVIRVVRTRRAAGDARAAGPATRP